MIAEVDFLLSNRFERQGMIGVIYGEDNRVEVQDSPDPRFRAWARSTAAMIPSIDLDQDLRIIAPTLREGLNLCPDVRFQEQFHSARCSGFLVAPNVILTAGHCVQEDRDCRDYFWVFDFLAGITKLKEKNVYRCTKILQSYHQGMDYALIELDRVVSNRKILPRRTSGKVKLGEPLVLIGNPMGLPIKIAAGAIVQDNAWPYSFTANTDSFTGNSGSAVIGLNSGVVEGILITGDDDYQESADGDGNVCLRPKICLPGECLGEDVLRISEIKGVPEVSSEKILSIIFNGDELFAANIGIPLQTYAYSFGEYFIGGRKFLDTCALTLGRIADGHWFYTIIAQCQPTDEFISLVENFRTSWSF